MSKILAQYILDVAKAHEAAFDKVASDLAVAAAEERAREIHNRTKPKTPAVTSNEIMGRDIYIDGTKHKVIKCLTNGVFRTERGSEGHIKYVRRRGQEFTCFSEEEIAESDRELNSEAIQEIHAAYVDFAKYQTKTIHQCAEEIVPVLYRQPVYLLLQTAWNDALDWAVTALATRDADGDDQNNFRFLIPNAKGGATDYQLSAQDELSAAFKLGQIFNEDLSIETVRLHMLPD